MILSLLRTLLYGSSCEIRTHDGRKAEQTVSQVVVWFLLIALYSPRAFIRYNDDVLYIHTGAFTSHSGCIYPILCSPQRVLMGWALHPSGRGRALNRRCHLKQDSTPLPFHHRSCTAPRPQRRMVQLCYLRLVFDARPRGTSLTKQRAHRIATVA